MAAAQAEAVRNAAAQVGGGPLGDAIRRDPQTEVTRLIERIVWTPDLAAALKVRGALAPGWCVVTLAGEVVREDGIVSMSSGESVLDRRAERDVLMREADEHEERAATERNAVARANRAADDAAQTAAAALSASDEARHERRRSEEQERVAQRRAEQLLRERDWEAAQVERLVADVASVKALVEQVSKDVDRLQAASSGTAGGGATNGRRCGAQKRAAHQARRDPARDRPAAGACP